MYSKQCQHKNILNKAVQSLGMLYEAEKQEGGLQGLNVEVNADFLCHVQELLLAYAVTYEQYENVALPEYGFVEEDTMEITFETEGN